MEKISQMHILKKVRFPMAAIFDGPDDYPGQIVVRIFDVEKQPQMATEYAAVYEDLESARADMKKAGFFCAVKRDGKDEKSLVETWI